LVYQAQQGACDALLDVLGRQFDDTGVHFVHPRTDGLVGLPGNSSVTSPTSCRGKGFACVSFIIDTFANRIVGWPPLGPLVCNALLGNQYHDPPKPTLAIAFEPIANTGSIPDALEQAFYARSPAHKSGLIHQSDRGTRPIPIDPIQRATGQSRTQNLRWQRWRRLPLSCM